MLHMQEKCTRLIVKYDIHETSTRYKTGQCASLDNHDEDRDGSEFRVVMLLQRQLEL